MTNFWKGKNVLVTGAEGFVGSHFAEELLLSGASVLGTSFVESVINTNDFTGNKGNIHIIKIDLLDFDAFWDSVSGKNINTIIHCAALDGNAEFKAKNSARIMDENSRMVSNVLNVAKKGGVPNVVLLSSAEVYAAQAVSPIVEEEDYQKYFAGESNGYVLAKIFSEVLGKLYAKQYNINVFFPRPTNIYGPRDKFDAHSNRVVPSMVYKILHEENIEIWGDGTQVRGFIYVKDLVYSILKMVESGKHQVMNIATNESISILELAKLIAATLKKEARITLLENKPMGVRARVLDNTKLQSIMDTPPRSLVEGLRTTVAWYQDILQEKN